MSDRLSPVDVSFLSAEGPTTPLHVGGVAVLEPREDGLDVAALRRRVEERIALVPRFRQRVRWVPASLGQPVWVDDARFDLAYHVRRVALPAPGSPEQLQTLVGRLISSHLDRSKPLWELYLVEGLASGRLAVLTKSHAALVDGVGGVDLLHVLLDDSPQAADAVGPVWRPAPEPGPVELAVEAVVDLLRHPTAAVGAVQTGARGAWSLASRAIGATGIGLLAAARPAPASPLTVEPGRQRRFAFVRTELEQYRRLRSRDGVTVNDVVLATVAGALRQWLLYRGAPVRPDTIVRALVPTSVRGGPPAAFGTGVGAAVATSLIDLPVGEPSPNVRLAQIAYAMRAHAEPGRRVGADALVRLSGFAPATFNAMATRAASGLSRRLFNLVVTNAPGPQRPLYAAGARLQEVYPVVPLAAGQALSIGVTSYDGQVYYGLNADWDALADLDVLPGLLAESIDELTEAMV
jgi:diacylglycerol O-acyltransferase